MNKEEYKKLLDSDYWKGYSYSIIKERNFTCEDCGKSFPNERNKLQVHHLVYRDVAPWSYRPEELIVLCKECHEKRHGIYRPQQHTNDSGSFSPTIIENQRNISDICTKEKPQNKRVINWICAILVVIALVYLPQLMHQTESSSNLPQVEAEPTINLQDIEIDKKDKKTVSTKVEKKSHQPQIKGNLKKESVAGAPIDKSGDSTSIDEADTSSGSQNDSYWIKRAKQEGVSAEGTDSDIQERLNHQYWAKRAKQEGVSAEGTDSDIQERLNHQYWVKRAKQEGVSAEGTDSDIQERLNHQYWVKRAKQEGVSTEGTDSDIQERLNQRYWENREKRELP